MPIFRKIITEELLNGKLMYIPVARNYLIKGFAVRCYTGI